MAIISQDSMETGVAASPFIAGTASLVTSPTRGAWSDYASRSNPTTTGTGYYAPLGTGDGIVLSTTVSAAAYYATFYFRIATLPASANEEFFAVLTTGLAAKMQLRIDSAGVISAYSGTTLIATGTAVLSLNNWYKIQVACGTGVGAVVEVKVNGTTDISTTANLSATNNGQVRLGKVTNRNGNSVDFYYDDAVISNSGYIAEAKVVALIPDASGTYQTFTIGAGSGSNYQVVGQRPPSLTTSYLVSSGTIGNAETEAMQPASAKSITGSILSVNPFIMMARNGATNGSVKRRFRSGASNFDTTSGFATTASASYTGTVYETDPNTGLAWDTSGIDGVEIGLIENSANKSRMASAFLLVVFDDVTPTGGPAPHHIRRANALSGGLLTLGGGF